MNFDRHSIWKTKRGKMRKHISIRSRFVLSLRRRSLCRRSGETHCALHSHFTEAWGRCKGRATIPASSQLPKIYPTQRPLICIINALIVPRGHRRVSVKRVAFQFANGSALSRNESNRYARWYGWRVMAQQAFVNWTPRIKIDDGSLARWFPRKSIGVIDFFRIRDSRCSLRSGVRGGTQLQSLVD